jgi:hypothetical protein
MRLLSPFFCAFVSASSMLVVIREFARLDDVVSLTVSLRSAGAAAVTTIRAEVGFV